MGGLSWEGIAWKVAWSLGPGTFAQGKRSASSLSLHSLALLVLLLSLSDQGAHRLFETVRVWLSNPSDRQLISKAEFHPFQHLEYLVIRVIRVISQAEYLSVYLISHTQMTDNKKIDGSLQAHSPCDVLPNFPSSKHSRSLLLFLMRAYSHNIRKPRHKSPQNPRLPAEPGELCALSLKSTSGSGTLDSCSVSTVPISFCLY